ncbi:MAG: hypothetical protein WEA34_13205, partial [Gemmatimonadota bacterium]
FNNLLTVITNSSEMMLENLSGEHHLLEDLSQIRKSDAPWAGPSREGHPETEDGDPPGPKDMSTSHAGGRICGGQLRPSPYVRALPSDRRAALGTEAPAQHAVSSRNDTGTS